MNFDRILRKEIKVSQYVGTFRLEDFAFVFEKLEALQFGSQYALMGGLGVECVRRTYAPNAPEIKSKDLDIRAGEPVVESLSRILGLPYSPIDFFDEVTEISSTMRELCFERAGEKPRKVQFLSRVPGWDGPEGAPPQGIVLRLACPGAERVSVLDPLSLFASKLYVSSRVLNQESAPRNDESHLGVLAQAIPPFLRQATAAYQLGKVSGNPAALSNKFLHSMAGWIKNLPAYIKPYRYDVTDACHECIRELSRVGCRAF